MSILGANQAGGDGATLAVPFPIRPRHRIYSWRRFLMKAPGDGRLFYVEVMVVTARMWERWQADPCHRAKPWRNWTAGPLVVALSIQF